MARPLSVTDEEIFDAAQNVMAQSGPAGFSISEVARQVGLSRAAITFRFEGPDQLKRATFARAIAFMEKEVATWTIEEGSEGLLEIASRIGRMVGGRENFGSFMMRFSENLDDPAGIEMEQQRGEVVRAAVGRAMPETCVTKAEAIDAFMANISGALLSWRASSGEDAEDFMVARTKVWLRLAGLMPEAKTGG
ncbi:helix-turn-helix domain-containing protein [Erythrobacter alti]|uniref:TetR/AcrR family transcriptional regulator n=1 Tax=Erythrobacter alti TaxID=1896145 RepID=UPI0030F42D11